MVVAEFRSLANSWASAIERVIGVTSFAISDFVLRVSSLSEAARQPTDEVPG
jgi:hypothetical protein